MKFDQNFIDKVRESNNIVDIIGQYSQLKSSSAGQYLGLCPYPDHGEKTPSFSVSESKQVYYCFGCKKTGNAFTFLRDIMGLTFPEAVEHLAKRASIEMPKQAASQDQIDKNQREKREQSLLKKINSLALQVFQKNLQTQPKNSMVSNYVESRGFNEEIIETFKLGYASPEWEHLAQVFREKSVPLGSAEKLGLIKRSKNLEKSRTGYFDILRGRLIFPILSPTGDVVGFGGRIVNPDDKPKYLNSPESQLFHKGKTLYGLFETAKFIRSADFAIVVEGYTDLIALYSAGIKNVVATLGTALTIDHAKLLKRYSKNVVVLFDGDQAGRVAAEKSLPLLLKEGLYPKGFLLPENQDPDEYLKAHGAKILKDRLRKAPDLFQMVMDWHFRGYTA
ncbi:MAG: DNA primase [Bdellovibrionales bacterium]